MIDERHAVIADTQHTLDRFEITGMETGIPQDYEKLLASLDDAVTQKRADTLALLDAWPSHKPATIVASHEGKIRFDLRIRMCRILAHSKKA